MLLSLTLVCSLIANNMAASTDDQLKYLTQHMKALTQQVMLQQFFTENRIRTEGQSGLKSLRLRGSGSKNYFVTTHSGYSAAAIHDHANNDRTVGMGEFTAVLNGIEFKTRHNDYRLYMPHRTSKGYHAFENIPFPDVPSAVTEKATIDEQIGEMREWFKAWRDQDYSERDYRKYFKPVLCYLEGAWGKSTKNIDEPFKSDRHFVDATSWMELHEKLRFIAYSGSKSRNENLSFLPTKIMTMINGTIPSFGQWNYRIMCHPLKRDLPVKRLRVVEDLASRMMANRDIHRHSKNRGARFELNSKDQDDFYERPLTWKSFLDDLMEEIPGKDNYQANLVDEGFETPAMQEDNKTPVNAGYYHRWYTINKDAMGLANQHRGYNDDYLFAALNTQERVASVPFNKCPNQWNKKNCYSLKQKWSYAIPLEIIYMTPLYKWNPYHLHHHGYQTKNNQAIVTKDGRNGGCDANGAKAFNGTTSRIYYRTPTAFFTGSVSGGSAADTARGSVCVLDQSGKPQMVRASGTYAFLPQIKDVGILRTRYPIFPVHGEGSSVWKELNALREVVMNEEKWKRMYWKYADLDSSKLEDVDLDMGYSSSPHTSKHTHTVSLSPEEYLMLRGGHFLEKISTQTNGHTHRLNIRFGYGKFYYTTCDGQDNCWDKHSKAFTKV